MACRGTLEITESSLRSLTLSLSWRLSETLSRILRRRISNFYYRGFYSNAPLKSLKILYHKQSNITLHLYCSFHRASSPDWLDITHAILSSNLGCQYNKENARARARKTREKNLVQTLLFSHPHIHLIILNTPFNFYEKRITFKQSPKRVMTPFDKSR